MKLTVGITNYNYGRYLAEAINSAISQGAEVIVVDDGSTDNTAEVLSMYDENPNVRVYNIVDGPTGNCAAGINEIIKYATGDYVLFLDGDDTLAPGAVSTFLNNAEGYDWVYSNMYLIDDDGDYIGGWVYDDFPTTAERAFAFARVRRQCPVPMKGIFRLKWLRDNNLKYLRWEGTRHAPDFRTCIDWLNHDPKIGFIPAFLYQYRDRADALPDDERELMEKELNDLIGGIDD